MKAKSMNRRDFLRLSATVTAGAFLTACGASGGASEGAQQEEAAAGDQAAPAASSAQGPIEFWDWDHTPRVEYIKKLVTDFQTANPGVELKYNPLGWTDIETKLLTVATAGSGPAF